MEYERFNASFLLEKLIKTYDEFGYIIIAYDFDNTVRDYQTGQKIFEIVNLLQELAPYGKFICYTAREDSELIFVKNYLIENQIPVDTINESYAEAPFKGKKLFYNVFLDDKCGLMEVYLILKTFIMKMEDRKNGNKN